MSVAAVTAIVVVVWYVKHGPRSAFGGEARQWLPDRPWSKLIADTMIVIQSPGLQLTQFQMMDAQEVFGCITPAIAKFMPWEHHRGASTWRDARKERRLQNPTKFSFVIRRLDVGDALAWPRWKTRILSRPDSAFGSRKAPTGRGFGREIVAALVESGHATLGKGSFIYPVALQNTASRRIAQNLHGKIIGNRTNPKYIYRIPFYELV